MENIIDSVQQFAQALENRNKNFKCLITPIITEALTGTAALPSVPVTAAQPQYITPQNFVLGDINSGEKIYYYGLLTVGNNVSYANLLVGTTEFLRITKNSQVVEYFTDVKYYDANNVLVASPQGHFRGYCLTLVNK